MLTRKNAQVSGQVLLEGIENEYKKKNKDKKSKKKKKPEKTIEEQLDSEDETLNDDDLPSIKNEMQNNPSYVSDDPLHVLIPKLMRLNEKDLALLRQHEITVKNGRFTALENSILLRNWERYLNDYNVPKKTLLLGHFQYEKSENSKLKKAYQKFARDTCLWLRLAKDLSNRTIYQIYCRARILLSDLIMAKDFNDQDRRIILHLYKKHGDNYTKFCEEHGYNPKSAREVVRNSIKANGKQLKRGEWTIEETKKLKSVVAKLKKELNLQSYEGLPWSRVAKKLKRSDMQCRQKFFSKGVYKMVTAKKVNKNNADGDQIDNWEEMRFDVAKFIALLKHLNYSNQDMIDWDFIKEKFSNNFFNILLRKWRELRIRIPNYEELTLPEIVDNLYQQKVLKKYGNDTEKMKEIENFINS